jgi:serine/threonine-protein kinase ULK/ATG1
LACKVLRKAEINDDEYCLASFKQEIEILKKIKSKNLIKLKAIRQDGTYYYQFYDFCNGGDLFNFVEIREKIKEEEARLILLQLINGYKAIFEHNVLHRDLKLENLLIQFTNYKQIEEMSKEEKKNFLKNVDLTKTPFTIKIADLGIAKQLRNSEVNFAESSCGSPLYMSPQVLSGKRYNYKTDIWSIGTLYFQLLTGSTPFNGTNKNNLRENYNRGTYIVPKDLELSIECLHFLDQCL